MSTLALKGRPDLYRAYEQDIALLNTRPKRVWVIVLLGVALVTPFLVPDDLLLIFALAWCASIGAIGLNLVTGYAGQVSLGHGFFLGMGAYTAAILGGPTDTPEVGLGFDMPIWLLGAGLVAALTGLLAAPLALRFRGLYLAIVTLGLVFLGDHIFKEASTLTGGLGVGRETAIPIVLGFRFDVPSVLLGYEFSRFQKLYWLGFVLLVVFALLARNLARSDVGRAWNAVRDRDVAAEVMGVSMVKSKFLAFTISSFYAGVAGALFYSFLGFVEPATFGLLLSVQYLAMILIGGVGTISGSIMGAFFVLFIPRLSQFIANLSPLTTDILTLGGLIEVFDAQNILYGLFIIVFLLFEPRGLFGIWIRIRNYWKGWPFSY